MSEEIAKITSIDVYKINNSDEDTKLNPIIFNFEKGRDGILNYIDKNITHWAMQQYSKIITISLLENFGLSLSLSDSWITLNINNNHFDLPMYFTYKNNNESERISLNNLYYIAKLTGSKQALPNNYVQYTLPNLKMQFTTIYRRGNKEDNSISIELK